MNGAPPNTLSTAGAAAASARALTRLVDALQALVAAAGPRAGLFPSVLTLEGAEPTELPPANPGQRQSDRSFPGANLMHDHSTLRVMFDAARAANCPALADAAEAYLHRFATHCTDTPTGLFPWGEHSFWNFESDAVGNSYTLKGRDDSPTHDHLIAAPRWLWDRLWSINPRCVERFAEGLDGHWQSDERTEYMRHAPIFGWERPASGVGAGARSCDFPRHGGFYAFDWSYAYLKTGRTDFRQQIVRVLDYWWDRRQPGDMVLSESRTPPSVAEHHRVIVTNQGLSLAVSLLESAALLTDAGDSELASRARKRGMAYLRGFCGAPHDLDAGRFVCGYPIDRPHELRYYRVWGSVYGTPPVGGAAVQCVAAYRLTGHAEALRFAEAVGHAYAATPLPDDVLVPAKDAGLALSLLLDLHDVTGEPLWRDAAASLAEESMRRFFRDDAPLPRCATGREHYESQCLPGHLFNGLARFALLDAGPSAIAADYTLR